MEEDDDLDDAATPSATAGRLGLPAASPEAGKRDWLAELKAVPLNDERERQQALDDAIAAGENVTLSHDAIPASDASAMMPRIEILLRKTAIGCMFVDDRGETLWIGKLGIDEDLRSRGYGQRAIELLSTLAAKEKYRLLAGEIELGPSDVMERRRRFCRKCGFAVRADDKVELHLDVPRRMFPRRPFPSGDWTGLCWFTDPQHAERLWAMRYEAADLAGARAALEMVYPGPFCRRYLDATARAREPARTDDAAIRKFRQRMALADGLTGLFEPHGPVSPILALGADLAQILKAKHSRRWLERFQTPADVPGAYFEAQVWANALRGAVEIERVPEKTGRKTGLKTPDFALAWSSWRLGLETKALSTGEHDMVRHEHWPLIHPLPPDDREYHIEVAAEIQALAAKPEGRERYREMFSRVEEALAAKKWELEQAGSLLGEHEVTGAGRITIAKRDPEFPGRSATVSFVSEATQEEKAKRLLPHLEDAAKKFQLWPNRASRVTVAMIDVPIDYNPDAVHHTLAAEMRGDLTLYRAVDAVVWRRRAWHMDPDLDPWKTYQHFACFVMRLPWSPMPTGPLGALSRLLLASPHGLMVPPRRPDRPDLVPPVAESTQVWTSEVEITPGAGI